MKKIFFISLTLLLAIGQISGQKTPVKFGKAVPEELKMTYCELDSTASAVILFDVGNSEIRYENNIGWMYTFSRHIRIKIFKSSGYNWASFEIPLYHSTSGEEKLVSIKGNTYNLIDGKEVISKLDREQVFEEEQDKNWFNMKFEMPDVKEGSVVEVSYYIRSDFIFNLRDWYFQTTIPTLLSEYHTSIPDYFKFHVFQKGYESFQTTQESNSKTISKVTTSGSGNKGYNSTNENYTSSILHMKAVNMPALNLEAYSLNEKNYATSVDYELEYYRFKSGGPQDFTTSWDRVNEILMKASDFGGQIGKAGYATDIIDLISAESSDTTERMSMAYNYVRKHIAWNKKNSFAVGTSLREVYNRRIGNSSEINFILLNILQELGIQAYPVVLSTRSNGIIPPTHATLKKLNHMIVYTKINGKKILLDASDPYFSPGILPEKCLNGQGIVIRNSGPGFMSLKPLIKSYYNSLYTLSLGSDGTLKGKLEYSHNGYFGIEERKNYDNFTDDEAYIKGLTDKHIGLNIENYKIILDSVKGDNFKLELDVDLSEHMSNMGDLVLIPVSFFDGVNENPFKLEERKYPVNFTYPREVTNIVSLTIPEGYTLEELPEPKMVALPDNGGKFIFSLSTLNNTIQVISKYSISKDEYLPSDYQALKEFYAIIVDKHSQHIVLKKNQ
ncbi:MAG: hypothetical protein ACOYXB_06060 [Bacteroidota bacterium]